MVIEREGKERGRKGEKETKGKVKRGEERGRGEREEGSERETKGEIERGGGRERGGREEERERARGRKREREKREGLIFRESRLAAMLHMSMPLTCLAHDTTHQRSTYSSNNNNNNTGADSNNCMHQSLCSCTAEYVMYQVKK